MVNVGPLAPARCTLDVPDGLTDADRAWLRRHAELAGAELESDRPGRPPADISWLRTEKIRG
jgi:hypothetical protein